MLRIAVVGSGPSGCYTAQGLVQQHPGALVDVLDRLPCPYGLVRYGVAPDHEKIKSLQNTLRTVLEHERVRFLGGVPVGPDGVPAARLRELYHAGVYCVGAAGDRRLGIPGEDLPGSWSATEFVSWYSAHPDAAADGFLTGVRSAVVIGVGNVAVDVTRMLARGVAELSPTDIPHAALTALAASRVSEISMVGRRGPTQARFTTKELRELGTLPDTEVVVDRRELAMDPACAEPAALPAPQRRKVEVRRAWAEAQLVLRSVGYRGVPLEGLPFDPATGTVPHRDGRVLRDGAVAPGEYVAGWIKRGPTGVIGTNRPCAKETVASLLADASALEGRSVPEEPVVALRAAGIDPVRWQGWCAIEQAEAELGASLGRGTVKLPDWRSLMRAAQGGGS